MSYIRTQVRGGVGEIVLDRPRALNALDLSMITEMHSVLEEWGDDDAIETVLVTSSSDRAFCAGGDIRVVRDHVLAGESDEVVRYFAAEYRLNQLVAEYPKPYVALVDGAAMGGGLGISVHGEVRVVTEKALIAMPETAIGFFPDVGSTYFLPRLPQGVGMWLGLTGARLRGADAVAIGLATHFVPSERIDDVANAVRRGDPLRDALADHRGPVTSDLPLRKIAEYFDDDNVVGIVGGLRGAVGDAWAEEMLDLLASASPTSLWVTAGLITAGATSSLAECLDRELAAAGRITRHPDFVEGVRAVLVDKDRNPAFSPATVEEVDAATVAAIIA
ncbi:MULTISPECIES: enoyl-CoA hydratase/isomerase family protein [Gordonia]|uniref:3-hydroxyisobutyryl-CoA hydrolase n=2 Tax=Gordonia TaxID=2053 RepID=L7LNG6_9ACTN|nr:MULTISPECIES: enoyl-CoA hydratase/isomerase family protein [Gordonia]AUH69760.1 enoyl-CoA hydratase/isomerase family protein [Gordonia sp. YC-JH1]KJR08790.1 enoyl-CoA hydratase [Gordonia sihwensis]KXT55705.1 enoyl-CoA hydratase [Gordonia sp. QH-12]MBY4571451.1 enoyl-CoA hydratase [Gordonia sihwensis]WFN93644.1 enoyl-CoA hydratase/isomerase family protein [Gordonia sihwensis]